MSALDRLRKAHVNKQVVGLKDVAGIKPRLDIDVLMRDDPDVFNLFTLAFVELKADDSPMGFFEIAGIHGLPRRLWDNVEGKKNVKKAAYSGYCAHSTETFPTWHRVYLGMLEQAFFLKMVDLAEKWDSAADKKRYGEAAMRFRLPYWDYYRPRGGKVTFPGVVDGDTGLTTFPYDYKLPLVFTSDKINVRRYPNDDLVRLDSESEYGLNPFYDYKFKPGQIKDDEWQVMDMKDTQLFPRDRTVRYPAYKGSSPGAFQSDVLNNMRMDSNRLMLTMLSDKPYESYDTFSTNKAHVPGAKMPNDSANAKWVWQESGASGSLEALHGNYHGLVGGDSGITGGGGGHLSRVPSAAFDPVFWFHHGQIERAFSLWQAIHADETTSWFTKTNPDTKVKQSQEPLTPFRLDSGTENFWSSDDVRTTEVLGYTYPEVQPDKVATLKRVRGMYEWSIPLTESSQIGDIPDDMVPVKVEETVFFKPFDDPQETPLLFTAAPVLTTALSEHIDQLETAIALPTKGYSREWYIDDKVQRLAMNGAFTVYYFIGHKDGTAPPPTSNLMLQGTLAGINHVFAAPIEACDNCGLQEEQAHIVTSTSAITSLLLDYVKLGELNSLEAEDVKPFLIARLKWRVLTINGQVINPRELSANKSFGVNVSCKKAMLPRDSGLEVTYENYPDIVDAIIANAS